MQYADLLRDVIARLGITGPEVTDDTRNFELTLKSGQVVTLSRFEDDSVCAVSALLCFFPEESRLRALFELLLAAHAFGFATAGAAFGVDSDNSKVFLFKTFDLQRIDLDGFLAEFDRFIQVHKTWLDAYDSGRLFGLLEDNSPRTDPRYGGVFA